MLGPETLEMKESKCQVKGWQLLKSGNQKGTVTDMSRLNHLRRNKIYIYIF